ncbi:6-O-methylguanine DNA methyltransferase, DNA binding domain-containing protein [Hirsutella rhossiliensis]|uniref:6-O-methylguanine DNA methyltransferase, DNA binding domain-containing protein n=1 Tax=Hirsutella rhossiliensis TaxID=111463 RepID=A0A9P8SKR5_9HYPO|nr:6-O-methylguanine DNA methyltransferase, DNA binding domain-containing protein [Hirsutella rhossiliensis]KAH0966166.1 6-O-methylguanine DNA methyltransferase, DNA binding domain-containing protein [Hirsutella rhossiliensis]
MPRSDEAEAFFHAVYAAVQEIPYGKVSSYGHIAMLVGTPRRPRQVGLCMKHLPSDPAVRFNSQNVPWQRVINSKGIISPRSQPSGAQNQAAALREEGVDVATSALGELIVDLARHGWFPRLLPSEAQDDQDEQGPDEN